MRNTVAVDATFGLGPLKGCLFTTIAKDGNNQLLLLAIAQFESESLDSWVAFLLQLVRDYPIIQVVVCDKQKELDCAKTVFSITCAFLSLCAAHGRQLRR